jgi:hypothetical protein
MYETLLSLWLMIKALIQNNFSTAIVSVFVILLFKLLNEKRARKNEKRVDEEYKRKGTNYS